jgi:predicted 2-oxoglutarate/Fe(II)-dependent dioxygenase YbiX
MPLQQQKKILGREEVQELKASLRNAKKADVKEELSQKLQKMVCQNKTKHKF